MSSELKYDNAKVSISSDDDDDDDDDDILSYKSSSPKHMDIRDSIKSDPLYVSELSDRLSTLHPSRRSASSVPNHQMFPTKQEPPPKMSHDVHMREMEYWKKKVSLEEEAAMKQAGMVLTLISNLLESLTSAVGFKHIKIEGLSTQVETALETGAFDLAIKNYCTNPATLHLLQSPTSSFITSFIHIVLRTHLKNVQQEKQTAMDKYKTTSPQQTTEGQDYMKDMSRFKAFMDTYMENNKTPPPPQPEQRAAFRPPNGSVSHNNIMKTVNDNLKTVKPLIGGLSKIISMNDSSIADTINEIDATHIPAVSI
jgi:hypothetical protein